MKSFWPILAILLGMLISQAHIYAFLIKYLLMLMLFFPFLRTKITTFYPHTLWIVVANIGVVPRYGYCWHSSSQTSAPIPS